MEYQFHWQRRAAFPADYFQIIGGNRIILMVGPHGRIMVPAATLPCGDEAPQPADMYTLSLIDYLFISWCGCGCFQSFFHSDASPSSAFHIFSPFGLFSFSFSFSLSLSLSFFLSFFLSFSHFHNSFHQLFGFVLIGALTPVQSSESPSP